MPKVVIIGDKYTVYALRLLGFTGYVIDKGSEVLKLVKELSEDENVGMILVTSNLVSEIRDEFNRLRMKMTKPLLMEIPTLKEVKYEKIDYLAILRAALGI